MENNRRFTGNSLYVLLIFLATFAINSQAQELAKSEPVKRSVEQILTELQDGNSKFSQTSTARRKGLLSHQSPKAIILSCSDSRLPPESIFDQGLGDIFVIRVAGNIIGAAQMASIEYAVEHLGTPLLIVIGHESCGAIKTALSIPTGHTTGSADLDNLVASIHANLSGMNRSASEIGPNFRKPAMINAEGVARNIIKRSKIVREKIALGGLNVRAGIYSMETGKVDFWALK